MPCASVLHNIFFVLASKHLLILSLTAPNLYHYGTAVLERSGPTQARVSQNRDSVWVPISFDITKQFACLKCRHLAAMCSYARPSPSCPNWTCSLLCLLMQSSLMYDDMMVVAAQRLALMHCHRSLAYMGVPGIVLWMNCRLNLQQCSRCHEYSSFIIFDHHFKTSNQTIQS